MWLAWTKSAQSIDSTSVRLSPISCRFSYCISYPPYPSDSPDPPDRRHSWPFRYQFGLQLKLKVMSINALIRSRDHPTIATCLEYFCKYKFPIPNKSCLEISHFLNHLAHWKHTNGLYFDDIFLLLLRFANYWFTS